MPLVIKTGVYCLSNSVTFQCVDHRKGADIADNLLFHTKGSQAAPKLAAGRLDFALQLVSFHFTLHLISAPLLSFYSYIAPKQKSKSPWKMGIKETPLLLPLSSRAYSRESRSPGHLPEVPAAAHPHSGHWPDGKCRLPSLSFCAVVRIQRQNVLAAAELMNLFFLTDLRPTSSTPTGFALPPCNILLAIPLPEILSVPFHLSAFPVPLQVL